MKKGIIFSIETTYAMIAVFSLMCGFDAFLPNIKQPSYDFISTMTVAHDVGQENSTSVPEGYMFGINCTQKVNGIFHNETVVNISYYDYNGTNPSKRLICSISTHNYTG